ncbi:MAG: TetR family transcriptional regulator [Alcanivorax sp.]|nr:TetR family transcriptional regulator [Alcanivorax sp.]
MNSCRFQRARSPEQKAARRAQILDAAAAFFASQRFEAISLADIARQAGVTKAALYRYFPSKEALFLALYLSALEQVSAAELTADVGLADSLTELLVSQPLFCRLTAIVHTVLEQNLDSEQAKAFKTALLERFSRLAERLQAQFGLTQPQSVRYLFQVQQSLIGCWAMSHPSRAVADVIDVPPLSIFRLDFRNALQLQLQALAAAL